MLRLCALSILACFLAPASSAIAQDDSPAVPVEQGWFHVPMFSNQYVTMLRVHIPAKTTSDYHIHSHDLVNVVINDYPPESYTQERGGPPNPGHNFARGAVSYAPWFSKPATHRAVNPGSIDVDIVGAQLNSPTPYGFVPETRDAAYTQVVDNNKVRAWKLALDPGAAAPPIKQTAPGVRIVVRGGMISEVSENGHERRKALSTGEFYWQEAGGTRAVRNVGSTKVEFAEIELK